MCVLPRYEAPKLETKNRRKFWNDGNSSEKIMISSFPVPCASSGSTRASMIEVAYQGQGEHTGNGKTSLQSASDNKLAHRALRMQRTERTYGFVAMLYISWNCCLKFVEAYCSTKATSPTHATLFVDRWDKRRKESPRRHAEHSDSRAISSVKGHNNQIA